MCCNYSSLPLQHERGHRPSINKWACCIPITFYSQKGGKYSRNNSTSSAQMLFSNIIHKEKKLGLLGEMSDSRPGARIMSDKLKRKEVLKKKNHVGSKSTETTKRAANSQS